MTDRTTLRAIMDAMKPGPKLTEGAALNLLEKLVFKGVLSEADLEPNPFEYPTVADMWRSKYERAKRYEVKFGNRLFKVRQTLTNLKPSNTKAQLLEGIEEAKAILNGDAA